MKFVMLGSLKESVDLAKLAEIIRRRAQYEFPPGVSMVGEYWTAQRSPAVVSILEADDATALMINYAAWVDVLDVAIFPVNTWQEGLEGLSKHFAGE